MSRRIAIVARAPSSRYLGPFDDESWEIWTLSPMGHPRFCDLPRFNRWYEVHNPVEKEVECPGYMDWMADLPEVWLREKHPKMPNAKVYPMAEVREYFGRPFVHEFQYWNNSVSLMISHAILEMGEDRSGEIGLWGVDMCQHTEYASQAPSCEFFIGWAAGAGITMNITPVCDLLKTGRVYGIEEPTAFEAKMSVHCKELEDKLRRHHNDLNEAKHQHVGALAAHQELTALLEKMNGKPEMKKQRRELEERLASVVQAGEKTKLRINELDSDIKMVTGALEENRYVRQWQQ